MDFNINDIYKGLYEDRNKGIIISVEDAAEVYEFITGYKIANKSVLSTIEYRIFLQACLISALNQSSIMNILASILRANLNPTTRVEKVLKLITQIIFSVYYTNYSRAKKRKITAFVIYNMRSRLRTAFNIINSDLGAKHLNRILGLNM